MVVDAVGPGRRALAINNISHRGQVVLILASVTPVRPAIGWDQISPRDSGRKVRHDLTVPQDGESYIEGARNAPQDLVFNPRNSVLIPENAVESAFSERPTIHDKSLAHHGER